MSDLEPKGQRESGVHNVAMVEGTDGFRGISHCNDVMRSLPQSSLLQSSLSTRSINSTLFIIKLVDISTASDRYIWNENTMYEFIFGISIAHDLSIVIYLPWQQCSYKSSCSIAPRGAERLPPSEREAATRSGNFTLRHGAIEHTTIPPLSCRSWHPSRSTPPSPPSTSHSLHETCFISDINQVQ